MIRSSSPGIACWRCFAAGFGALLAPLVADARDHSTSATERASDRRGTQ